MTTIRPLRVNHMNAVVEQFDGAVGHFGELFDAEFLLDLPQAEWHACLVETGGVIFELFVPPANLLFARYGPHYLGLEYQADMADVRAAIAERGIRIARDIGVAVHTHPADTLCIAFEFYDGSFHDNDWPLLGGGKMRAASWWRDEHPLGFTGLAAYTVAVRDLSAASAFLTGFLDARLLREEDRPGAGARAAVFRVADCDVELLAPAGDGLVRRQLDRYGEGIFSTVFGVRDLDRARAVLGDRGVPLVPGSAPRRLALPAERNLGLCFEFTA